MQSETRRVRVLAKDRLALPCLNCGNDAGQEVILEHETYGVLFSACNVCWPRVETRQMHVLQGMLKRAHDRKQKQDTQRTVDMSSKARQALLAQP